MNLTGTDSYKIRAYEVAPDKKARFATMCDLLQESASRHAESLGFGYHGMLERNLFWVLTRMTVRVTRFPEYGENVVVHTWPKGINGPFALRDFRIVDLSDRVLLSATSGWLVIDSQTRKPGRPTAILETMQDFPKDDAISEPPIKVGRLDGFDRSGTIISRPSDEDLQNHVNSMRYVSWIEDAYYGRREGEDGPEAIYGIDINFVQETRSGETLTWSIQNNEGQSEPGIIGARIVRESDKSEVVRARLIIGSGEA